MRIVARRRVRGCVVVALGALLGACGGDEQETGAASGGADQTLANTGTPPPVAAEAANRPPRITGAPATFVLQSTQYAFTPAASDPDGDPLTYYIANAPAWASFDTATGRLMGMPEPQHVGATSSIVISVSDGELSASLPAFSLTVQAVASGSATLSWLPPTANTDGSPLTNLAGYRVYWGTSAGEYPNSVTLSNPGLTRYVVTNLVAGTWFFAATALNSSGAESTFSNPTRIAIP